MEETRKARIDHIFRCAPKRGEERVAVGFARWKERQEKNIASVISFANKFKSLFHSKPVSRSKAASKEVQKPALHILASSNSPKVSLKKPPFIVPGRIRHNDLHLLQSLPQVKNPPKKNAPTKQSFRTPATQWGTSKQASTKNKSAAPVFKTSSKIVTDACPQCKGFVPPAGMKVHEQSSTSVAQETDYQHESSAKLPQNNFQFSSKSNPWITVDRRTSIQKPFNSLLPSRESSAPQAPFFLEDVPDLDNEEENFDRELKSFVDLSIHHGNEDQDLVKNSHESNVCCKIKMGEDHHEQIIVVAEVHPVISDHVNKNDSADEIESVTLPEIGELSAPERVEIALHLRAQVDEKKTYLNGLCNQWNSILEEGDTIPQDEVGSILTVIGQTQQLQRERFHQYATLILQFEKNTAEKTITKTDLEGFWEMISLQVTDVENKFIQLDSLRRANWKRQENVESRDRKKKNPKKTEKKKDLDESGMKSSGVRSHIVALRRKQMETLKSVTDNPVAFLDQQPFPVILLTRLIIEANGVSQLKQNDREGDTIQQADSCQSVMSSSNRETCAVNKDILDTSQHNYELRDRKKHKSANNKNFFSSPHQINISRQRSRSTDCKVDKPSLPTSPDSSIPNNDTPVSIKIYRKERKKHNSAIGIGYFSSPHETDSPRQRSRTTEGILDPISVPSSLEKRTKMPAFNQVRDSFKPFSPTVKQVVTRSGRISQSSVRFGQNDTTSPYLLRLSCYQYTKQEKGNTDPPSPKKEES